MQSYDDYFKPLLNDLLYDSFRQRVFSLKIRLHSKQELFDKDFLESSDVILFVEHEQSLLIVDGVNGSERNRAIAICYLDSIARDSCSPLVSIHKGLNIR